MEPISVTDPIGLAIERVRQVLFRPFDLGKWFIIGFCAWLAQLGESGSGGNFNNGSNSSSSGNAHQQFDHAREELMRNLYWILPAAVALIALALVIWAVFLWLNSRGKFMFLHCVALNRAEVREPWNRFAGAANSLFLFRLVVGLIGMVLVLPMVLLMAVMTISMFAHDSWNPFGIMALICIGMALVLVSILFLLFRKLTTDFVVPIMFLRGNRCVDAWREFLPIFTGRLGNFALYILFQIVIALAIAIIAFFAVIITCCIAGCIMMIPYLGTVLLLPLIVFQRAYSLYYFAQYGQAYNVFPPATAQGP